MRLGAWSFLFPLASLPLLVRSEDYEPTLQHTDEVDRDTRRSWCAQQKANCPLICVNLTTENHCNPGSLTYTCGCDVSNFKNTLPWFVCNYLRSTYCGNPDTADRCPEDCGLERDVPQTMSGMTTPGGGDPGKEHGPPTMEPNGFGQSTSASLPQTTAVIESTQAGPSTTSGGESVTVTSATATASVDAINTAGASAEPTSAVSAVKSGGGGLSTGAKAGIAVGAVAGFAMLALLVFFLLRNRRKKHTPLLADETKNLGVGPSTMSQDPYSDSPGNGSGDARFSWAQNNQPMSVVPPVQQPYGHPVARDIAPEEAGYWQASPTTSPISPQTRHSDIIAAPRASMQEARSPSSPEQQPASAYVAYAPAPQEPPVSAVQRGVEHGWDEDERRLEAEMAEIDRMRQQREERSAMR